MIQIYHNIKEDNKDTNNTATTTAGVDVITCDQLTFYVIPGDGAHENHVVTLQFSPEDVDGSYQDSPHTITKGGCLHVNDIESISWARLKVTTPEGAVSTCDLAIDPSRKVRMFC